MIELTERRLKRFWGNVQKSDGCWLWTGPKRNGYGVVTEMFSDRSRITEPAHRIAYRIEHGGPIPFGLEIDHTCHNADPDCAGGTADPCDHRRCVNPAHLEAVTHEENIRRHFAKIRECRNGHPRSTENTILLAGVPTCRRCVLDRQIEKRDLAKAELAAGVRTLARHGTTADYTKGCRCVECRAARREYDRVRQLKRTETRRAAKKALKSAPEME